MIPTTPLLAFANHLLAAEPWARTRLRPFAGQQARIELGQLSTTVAIAGDGTLVAGKAHEAAAVTVQLPGDAPLRLLREREALLANARISGAVDFADTLGFVARNLRWDVEADLARVVGDVFAHRAAQLGARCVSQARDALMRLQANVSEFAEEQSTPVRPREIAGFAREVTALTEDLDRLTQRIARL